MSPGVTVRGASRSVYRYPTTKAGNKHSCIQTMHHPGHKHKKTKPKTKTYEKVLIPPLNNPASQQGTWAAAISTGSTHTPTAPLVPPNPEQRPKDAQPRSQDSTVSPPQRARSILQVSTSPDQGYSSSQYWHSTTQPSNPQSTDSPYLPHQLPQTPTQTQNTRTQSQVGSTVDLRLRGRRVGRDPVGVAP